MAAAAEFMAASEPESIATARRYLFSRKLDHAIAKLQLAARDPAIRPAALTDLSAVYLLRFEEEGDPLDLLRAIPASERAPIGQPGNEASSFNRARDFSLLGTRLLAEQSFRKIDQTREGGWRNEAGAQLRFLAAPPLDDRWKRVLPMIEAPDASSSVIERLVEQYPAHARAYADDEAGISWRRSWKRLRRFTPPVVKI